MKLPSLLLLCLLLSGYALAEVRINEIMASNGETIADEDGDFEDWIELVNTGAETVDLSGWGLSDNDNQPFKWSFPAGTSIASGEFLLVWASGKDRNEPAGPLHTNYSISAAGEPISLTRPDSTTADYVQEIAIPRDISYGRKPDGTGDWFFFKMATPGTTNSTEAFNEVLAPPEFSNEAGFYTESFDLIISHPDPDVSIWYTLDGSEPVPERSEGVEFLYKNNYPRDPGDSFGEFISGEMRSHEYADPVSITDRATDPNLLSTISTTATANPNSYVPNTNVFKITPVRAIAVKPGSISSRPATASFIVSPAGADRFELPVVSITTDSDNLFGYESGIYVAGKIFDDWRTANPNANFNRNFTNFFQRGQEWERTMHLEMFDENGKRVVSQGVGGRIHGGATRQMAQKSIRIYAAPRYDEYDRINYPVLGNHLGRTTGEPIQSYKRLILRNGGNGTFIVKFKDYMSQRFLEPLGLDYQEYQPVIQFINGEYWGIVNIRERIDRFFLHNHHGVNPDHVAILSVWEKIGGFEKFAVKILSNIKY